MNRARLQRDLGWGAAAIVLLAVTTARSGETDLFERDLSERHRLFDRHLRFDADSSTFGDAPGAGSTCGPRRPTNANGCGPTARSRPVPSPCGAVSRAAHGTTAAPGIRVGGVKGRSNSSASVCHNRPRRQPAGGGGRWPLNPPPRRPSRQRGPIPPRSAIAPRRPIPPRPPRPPRRTELPGRSEEGVSAVAGGVDPRSVAAERQRHRLGEMDDGLRSAAAE